MSECCKYCRLADLNDANIDGSDAEAVAAAIILFNLSRTHFDADDSPSCTCGGLPSMSELIRNADDYPETEAEDWKSMGAESLCVRASGVRSTPSPQHELDVKDEGKLNVRRTPGKTTPALTERAAERAQKSLKVTGAIKQEDKGGLEIETGLRRSKRVKLAGVEPGGSQ
jgi:hypothetical protein